MRIDKNTTASFDIDPQNGFTPLCPQELPVSGGTEVAQPLNQQAKFARLRVVSKDAHPAKAIWVASDEEPQFTPVHGKHVDIRWQLHCVPGTKGFELIEGLPDIADYDFVVFKGVEPNMHPYGACYHDLDDTLSTGVIEYLKQQGIETVICGGLATDYCVKLTVLQLRRAGFRVLVNLAACRGIEQQSIDGALVEMKNSGATIIQTLQELELA